MSTDRAAMNNASSSRQTCLLPDAISELFVEVIETGQITLSDCQGLMAALFNSPLTEDEKNSVNRLLHSVRQGRLKVVEEPCRSSRAERATVPTERRQSLLTLAR